MASHVPDAVRPAKRTVYLMRGLPCCRKSHTAGKSARETGLVCETDEYFHSVRQFVDNLADHGVQHLVAIVVGAELGEEPVLAALASE